VNGVVAVGAIRGPSYSTKYASSAGTFTEASKQPQADNHSREAL
jgi:hypothetical protein